MYHTLITIDQLKNLTTQTSPLRIFDCSADLMKPEAGLQQFEKIHIQNASHVDLNQSLSAHDDMPRVNGGRHPLPTREVFAQWLGSQGIDHNTQVVVYDRQNANYCGRLWWMLKWCGHQAVAVLDGGFKAWEASQGACASGQSVAPLAKKFELKTELATLKTTQEVSQQLGKPTQHLIDARATPRFNGEVEPLDPIAGHIPGALNRPFGLNMNDKGFFKSPQELLKEFEALLAGRNPQDVVHHCGSGVSAVPNIIAMEVAGLGHTALYAGSWSEWCNTPKLPCVTK